MNNGTNDTNLHRKCWVNLEVSAGDTVKSWLNELKNRQGKKEKYKIKGKMLGKFLKN